MPHSPDFSLDEECLRAGVAEFFSLIYDRAKIK
jgi:hypothetical protein